jgi:hypothetical protein
MRNTLIVAVLSFLSGYEMPEKRKKRGFDISNFFDDNFMLDDSIGSESSSGYSISVTYGNDGKPVVKVQTQGKIDKTALKNELKKKYPDAEIEGLANEPLIKEISTKTLKPEKKQKKKNSSKV